MEAFLQYRVDGVVLGSVGLSSAWATACEQAGVPVILFNRFVDSAHVSPVSVDNLAGGRAVAEFLIAAGHRRIAYIAGTQDSSSQRDREAGFRQALTAHGVPLFDRAVGDFEDEAAKRAARQLFDRPAAERPDAVFAASDQMALAVMDVLRFDLGLRIPDDVSIVGFDDVPQAAWPAYDLTTMRQVVDDVVNATVEALMERIEQPASPPRRTRMPAQLVVRRSARVPTGWSTGQFHSDNVGGEALAERLRQR